MAECIISGRQGPKGDIGPQGATGPWGPVGPQGSNNSYYSTSYDAPYGYLPLLANGYRVYALQGDTVSEAVYYYASVKHP